MAPIENVSIPINLDAFVLCEDSCNGDSRIAPITQPNYVGLRLDSYLIQHDLLEHVDFHSSKPVERNPRLTDLGADPPAFRNNRLGVHVHWSLPRFYRTATSDADSRTAQPGSTKPTGNTDPAQPVFRKVPNRWLLIRHLNSCDPPAMLPALQFQSWLIESDRLRKIINSTDQADLEIDLESDVTPFVAYNTSSQKANVEGSLQAQAEVFIGKKTLLQDIKNDPPGEYVDLTVMNSSNPLFPDYALHNANVFSTIDNFQYKDNPNDKDYKYLKSAEVDYYVLGWNSNIDDDPLSKIDTDLPQTLSKRISNLMLTLSKDDKSVKMGTKLEATRSLLYGAIYGVSYDRKKKPPCRADDAAKKFGPTMKIEPLSVGSTAIDGILTFLEAHPDESMVDVFGTDTKQITKDILAMSQLLYSADDSYNARIKASDLLLQNNYVPSVGGQRWAYAGKASPGDPSAQPTPTDLDNIQLLNLYQTRLDATERKRTSSRWQLFAEWWKFVSDGDNDVSGGTDAEKDKAKKKWEAYAKAALDLTNEVRALNAIHDDMTQKISSKKSEVECKVASTAPYFLRKDPTLCIAGLDSGWPTDYMAALHVRLDHELFVDTQVADVASKDGTFKEFLQDVLGLLPLDKSLKTVAERLLAEIRDHELADADREMTTGFKSWGGENPFVPLFIEFEILYYHIPFNKWNVRLRNSPVGHNYQQVRYGLNSTLYDDPEKDNQKDWCTASGRVLVLPQPVFSLEASVNSVLSNAGPLPKDVDPHYIGDHIKELKFISAPLSGITNQLLTRADGGHVVPYVRGQGEKPVALIAAVKAGTIPGLLDSEPVKEMLELIEGESALTPYGNLFNFGHDFPSTPFKGVTSGQMMFTKINIIDKFGQAICLPDPLPRPRIVPEKRPTVYPCISDYLMPEVLEDKTLNTIYYEPEHVTTPWPMSRFMQLTPSINQEARINAAFVIPPNGAKFKEWREAGDFDQPIFAWIVVNYANSGLQFFLPNGTFYREIRMGGVTGTNTSTKWLPFDPPTPPADNAPITQTTQLDLLIKQLTSDTSGIYLQGFFDMINGSIANMPYPPSEYSAYANAIVGKPLALVNVGYSLELAAPAIKAQNTLGKVPNNEQTELEAYAFPIKIGDIERPFDGVVGYYHANNSTNGSTDFAELFTYFAPHPLDKPPNRKITKIDPSNFETLHPYCLDPDPKATPDLPAAHCAKYKIKTLLIDPYTPLHVYSPILPIKSLQLPGWTIQSALKRMTAFFRLGPSLLTKDVPAKYDRNAPLKPDTWATPKTAAAVAAGAQANPKAAGIKLPIAGTKGLWNWLQPYENPDDPNDPEPKFNSLDVGEEDTRLRHDPGPYTFLEGYLQLARPLIKEDIGL